MNEYLVEFLPADMRLRGVMMASRRRSTLLVALLAAMTVGVAAHSWNRYRAADAQRGVAMQLTTTSGKFDDVVDRLASEQHTLSRYIAAYEHLALPVSPRDLFATLTHLMPERMSLASVRIEAAEEKQAGDAARQAAAPGAKQAQRREPERWMEVTVRGYAGGNADLYEFERRLAHAAPFERVTVTDNKAVDVPGSRVQEFTISCRVPLTGVRYEGGRDARAAVAAAQGAPR
jgi:hypothetical protein